jgi:tRNA pseudouridine38-40 synthase
MVRNIVGSLMAVGTRRQPTGWIEQLMMGRDRTLAADTAPADGLYLSEVEYPAQYQFPPTPLGPMLPGLPAYN